VNRYSVVAIAMAALTSGCAETYTPRPAPTFMATAGPLSTAYAAGEVHADADEGRAGTPLPPKAVELFGPDAVRNGRTTGPTMSLEEVVRLAVLRDPAIRAALADVEAAKADVVRSETMPNPAFIATQSLVPFPGRPFTVERTGGPPQLDIVVSYALDRIVFGKRSAAIARDKLAVDSASAAHADRVRTRIAEAVTAYVDVLEARASWVLASEVYGHARRLQDVTNSRTGDTAAAERGRVRIFLLTTHRAVMSTGAALESARARLRERLTLRPDEPTPEPAGFPLVDHPAPPPSEEAAIRAALESRPDLEASHRDAQRARAGVRAEKREGFPTLGVVGITSRQFQEQALGSPNVWSYGFGLYGTIPVLDRNQGGILRAQAGVMAADASYAANVQQVESEVRVALAEYRAAYQAIMEANEGLLRGAGEMRLGIREAYASGAKSLLEVLDAEESFSDAMRLEIEEEAGYVRAYHRLNAAVGRAILSPEP
jgi:cobalt-zinc-cadmium efflux system outer membrane protein